MVESNSTPPTNTTYKAILQTMWEEIGFKQRYICRDKFPALNLRSEHENDLEVSGKPVQRRFQKCIL